MQNFGQYGQYGQFDQYGQFTPDMPAGQMPDHMPFGQNVGYGNQWAQYEDQVAAYSASLQQNQNPAEGAEQQTDGTEQQTPAQEGGDPAGDYNMYGDGETDGFYGYGGFDNGYVMPVYGYDATYMPEFGVDTQPQYNYVYDQTAVMQQPYIDGDQPVVQQRWRAHPVLVFSLLLICFPIGLALMLFFTDWGAFAKIYTTVFVLAMALAVYEILIYKQMFAAPSIIQSVMDFFA